MRGKKGRSMAMVQRLRFRVPAICSKRRRGVATIAGSDIGATIFPLAEVTIEWLTVKPPVRDVSL